MSKITSVENVLNKANFAGNASLVTVTEIDNNSVFIINQTTTNITLTVPNRTALNAGDKIQVINNGTANLYIKPTGSTFGTELAAKSKIDLVCDGTKWIVDNIGGTEFFGAIRNTGGTWGIINDAAHESHNLDSVIDPLSTAYKAQVNYNIPTEQVGTAMVSADDTYVLYGIAAGVSQGVSYGSIAFAKQGFGVYIAYNGTDWVANTGGGTELMQPSDFTFTYAAGVLTVTHTVSFHKDVFNISATGRNGVHVQLDSIGATSFQLIFRDLTGALITTPTTACRAFVARNGMYVPDNTKLAITGSNVWIYGKYKN